MKPKNTQPALSRSQATGVIILGTLLLAATLFWRLSSVFDNNETKQLPIADTGQYVAPISERQRYQTDRPWNGREDENASEAATLFTFNPNTASEQDFIRLGLPERVARTICKYRSKGGHFYRKEDFSKIYTLSQADYQRLLPYIRIPEEQKEYQNYSYTTPNRLARNTGADSSQGYRKYPVKQNKPVFINTCTAEDLMRLRGIGTGYAGRIISYRDILGGFVAKEQLKEVYGMNDSLYTAIEPFIIIEPDKTRKISLNNATETEWQQHPYTRKMVKYILLYRKDIGSFKQIEDFRKVPLINEEKYRKIAPYLSL